MISWFPTLLFSLHMTSAVLRRVYVCGVVSVYSWGSFHWWWLHGLKDGECTGSSRLLCWHRLQNRSAKWTHVLPSRPGTNYTDHSFTYQVIFWVYKTYNVFALQNDVCQVVLDSGHVVVSTSENGVRSQKTYNDDNSHYVAFYRNQDGYATLCFL